MNSKSLIDLIFKRVEPSGKRTLTTLGWVLVMALMMLFLMASFMKPERKVKDGGDGDYVTKEDILSIIGTEPKAVVVEQEPKEKMITPYSEDQEIEYISVIDNSSYIETAAVPYGSIVRCILINRIVTNNFSAPVVAQVKDSFYFNDELLLKVGTRIYGEAKKGIEDDRVLVAFHRIVFQDGREIGINARGLNSDLSGGVQATIIDDDTKPRILARVLNFVSGTLLGLQDQATNALTGLNQIQNSSRNALLEGGAEALDEEAKRIDRSLEASRGKGVVPEGTEIYVFFDEKIALDKGAR